MVSVMIRRAAYLARMLHNESLSPATLAARQRGSLCDLLRHAAARVPFYRDLYAAHGVSITQFNGADDLQRLPIVDKQLLRAAGAAAVSLDAPARRVTISTSGSTGEPFEFEIDRRYDQWRKAQYLRPYFSCGRRLTDKVLHLTGRTEVRAPWFSRLGLLRELRMAASTEPTRIAQAWRELAPHVLQAFPSSLRSLAHHCLDRGEPLTPAPRLVFSDSEQLSAETRALAERAFGTQVIDVFGTFETDNIAYQCAARDGYHITTDCVVLEIIRDGRPVPHGEEGDIVVTVLGNRTHPFIRYNLRDRGVLSTRPCSCGRPFPLLEAIQGRADDLIVLAGGQRRSARDVLRHLARIAVAAQHYQLHQLDVGRFELLVVPSRRFAAADKDSLMNIIGSMLAPAKLELRVVDAIAQDRSGKRRAFISRLPATPDA